LDWFVIFPTGKTGPQEKIMFGLGIAESPAKAVLRVSLRPPVKMDWWFENLPTQMPARKQQVQGFVNRVH
jgi:hypothetical protein